MADVRQLRHRQGRGRHEERRRRGGGRRRRCYNHHLHLPSLPQLCRFIDSVTHTLLLSLSLPLPLFLSLSLSLSLPLSLSLSLSHTHTTSSAQQSRQALARKGGVEHPVLHTSNHERNNLSMSRGVDARVEHPVLSSRPGTHTHTHTHTRTQVRTGTAHAHIIYTEKKVCECVNVCLGAAPVWRRGWAVCVCVCVCVSVCE